MLKNAESIAVLSDEQLISRLASGKVEFLGEIYMRYDVMVKTALNRFAQDISFEEREDLAQDIFIAVNDSASKFPAGVEFRLWLYGMTVKKARARRRSNWVRNKLLKMRSTMPVGTALRVDTSPARQSELRQLIEKALASLSDDERDVLMLRAVEGFKGDEIAQILRISHNSVRVRIHRARAKIDNEMTALRKDLP